VTALINFNDIFSKQENSFVKQNSYQYQEQEPGSALSRFSWFLHQKKGPAGPKPQGRPAQNA
jgi:hypothetical protein